VTLPGQAWGLAAAGPNGPVFATSYRGRDMAATVLTAVDAAGLVMWQRDFEGHPGPPRVSATGTVWVAHRDDAGHILAEVNSDNAVVRSIRPEQQSNEQLGAFVVLPDGFVTLWVPRSGRQPEASGAVSRVARNTENGGTVWSTPLPIDRLSFPGVVETGRHTGGHIRPVKPWRPTKIEVGHDQPLVVSADRILVGLTDSSGIGVCTLLNLTTGSIVAATEPAPYHQKAIAGHGRFLIGQQGYGAFCSTLYDQDGSPAKTWPSHGMMLITRHGRIAGPESENRIPSRSRFRVLVPDGSMRDGPLLSGYYTSYPAIDTEGNTLFWRDGKLLVIDAHLRSHSLYADDDRAVMSRVLLAERGRVLLALHDELLIFTGTGLSELDSGPWPCEDGNLRGNPVDLL